MGGADPANATAAVLAAVHGVVPAAWIDVVLGPSYRHPTPEADPRVRIHRAPDDYAGLLAAADLAVGAGGTSALERCAIGLPSVNLQIAENQRANAATLAEIGAAVDAGPLDDDAAARVAGHVAALAGDPDGRAEMRERGLRLVDGHGAVRVASVIDPIRLRPVDWGDQDRLLAWANDPTTRANSLSTHRIGDAEHDAWLRGRLADDQTEMFIGEDGRGAVGHIRFDLAAVAEVSIVVAPEHRGGTGSSLLGAAVTRWRADHGDAPLRARVRTGNLASRRSFERAGFDLQAEADGILAYRLDGGPGRPEPATRRSTG